ncbi:DEAD/DEAH box helicase [Marinomonas agarivorans]|nr:DEAD/DEAH box helicase [Marinomonas agarivorans]
MQFTDFGFDARILKAIHHLGFEDATEVQNRAIPEAMAGRDLLVSSKTGSGKTLAYLIPALHRVYRVKALSNRDARVLILLPTRELAKQVFAQLRLFIAGSKLRATIILGGENFNEQQKNLQKNPQFIVATPGRLVDHLKQRNLFLDGLELLILDEADRMLDLGFADELKFVDDAASHRLRQTLFFSATLDKAEINELAQRLLKEPYRVAIGASTDLHTDIQQQVYLCDHLDHKEAVFLRLIEQKSIKQVIVFTATKADTVRLAQLLNDQGYSAAALNGDLSQSARNKVMNDFMKGLFHVLVSTDLAARGIDIGSVSHVINFDIPKQAEEFIHRTGRTGRAGFQGNAYSLVGPKDWYNFVAIENLLERKFEFDVLEGLEPSFKGLKPKKVAPTKVKNKNTTPDVVLEKVKKNPKKRKKQFHNNNQDGFEAFKMPKRKATGIPLDDSE